MNCRDDLLGRHAKNAGANGRFTVPNIFNSERPYIKMSNFLQCSLNNH